MVVRSVFRGKTLKRYLNGGAFTLDVKSVLNENENLGGIQGGI
jgi:hypothetical protein